MYFTIFHIIWHFDEWILWLHLRCSISPYLTNKTFDTFHEIREVQALVTVGRRKQLKKQAHEVPRCDTSINFPIMVPWPRDGSVQGILGDFDNPWCCSYLLCKGRIMLCRCNRIQVQPMKAIAESLYQNILKLKGKHNCKQHFTDLPWQMCLGFGGISWFSDCRIHHWQLLRKMAAVPNLHHLYDLPNWDAWLPSGDSLSTFGFQHCPQLWPSQGWQPVIVWKR